MAKPTPRHELVADSLDVIKRFRVKRFHRATVHPGREEAIVVLEVIVPADYSMIDLEMLTQAATILMIYPEYLQAIVPPPTQRQMFRLDGEDE